MTRQPNILLIISDDHRASAIRAAGDPVVQTPVLDRLMARGASFQRAHIMGGLTGAVCVPSRACLHTGAHIFRNTVSTQIESGPGLTTLRPELAVLGATLRGAGYRAFATGKWHNDKASFARSFDDGATLFFGGMSDHDRVPLRPFDPAGAYPDDAVTLAEGFSTDLFTDSAVDFLRSYADERPFFLYLAYTAPHDPRTPPPEFAALYDPASIPLPPNFLPEHPFDNGEITVRDEKLAGWPRTPDEVRRHLAGYYGMISHMDAAIGRVLAALADTGRADDTIVVYMADHGLAVGQHGLMGKQNLYDHSIRVPLILAGPGIAAGRTVAAPVYSYSLFPTLCDLAGLPIPATVDSPSLAPLLAGSTQRVHDTLFSAYKDVQRSVTDGEWKLIRYTRAADGQAGEERVQLFHLTDDPWEIHDLAGNAGCRGQRTRLEAALAGWQYQLGDPVLGSRFNARGAKGARDASALSPLADP